jgi:SAM-dependent methyltransferase
VLGHHLPESRNRKDNVKKLDALLKNKSGIRLDIGCGEGKHPGFVGMDNRPLPGVDIVHDVESFPWPLPDECVLTAVASHLVEHIEPHGGVFMRFMDEVWRVMKPDGEFAIVTPYAGSVGFYQDPTHCNPCNENTFRYFDPEDESGLWRIYKPNPWKIKVNNYNMNGNLEIVLIRRSK